MRKIRQMIGITIGALAMTVLSSGTTTNAVAVTTPPTVETPSEPAEVTRPAKVTLSVTAAYDEAYGRITYYKNADMSAWSAYVKCTYDIDAGDETVTVKATSSDESVLKVDADDREITYEPGMRSSGTRHINLEIMGIGHSTIMVQAAGQVSTVDFYVVPEAVNIQNIVQSGYRHITISWDKVSGVDGYVIQRSIQGKDKFSTIKTVQGDKTISAEVATSWNKKYEYRVVGYVTNGTHTELGSTGMARNFTAEKIGAEMKSVSKKGASSLKIKWSSIKGANAYILYRSTSENGKYKKIYTAKGENNTSYTQKVKKGQTYYYRVVTKYAEGKSNASQSISGFIPKKGSASQIVQTGISQGVKSYGQYPGYWSSPDETYYYISGGKLHQVTVRGKELHIYTLHPSTLKVTSTRKVNLEGYDHWGGFYHGTDGCFYVAVGYNNPEEQDSKTVIKVYQYSKKWKLKKTCNIKGSASNVFKGIYIPFDAGNCRMDMSGNTLYLFTAREMYEGSDGLHHQSNIAFKINTKTMKYKDATESYCSHSFNQFVKFKDGDLYQADHGDAYPRAISLTITKDYGTTKQTKLQNSVFNIEGITGDNATGVTIGGMEVGKNKVMICGTSVPHKQKQSSGATVVNTNWNNGYKHNVYLIAVNKNTGKRSIKWLTNYDPKTTTTIVGETRMVKLSDSHFAILYNTTTADGATELNYVVVNNNGKKVYSKIYSGMSCVGASQPILYKGNIIWTETAWGDNYQEKTTTYRIPAVY